MLILFFFMLIFVFFPSSYSCFSPTPMLQAGGRLGQDRWIALCDCWCADHCAARARHRFQLQLLLPPGNRSGRDAVAEFQSCYQLSLPPRYTRSVQYQIPLCKVAKWCMLFRQYSAFYFMFFINYLHSVQFFAYFHFICL